MTFKNSALYGLLYGTEAVHTKFTVVAPQKRLISYTVHESKNVQTFRKTAN